MITFKKFLAEESSELQKIIALIEKHSPKYAASKASPLFRGSKTEVPNGVRSPRPGRESRNTSNYYTVLTDTNPLNKGWPLRSESFIATSSLRYASNYGKPSLVIPFDDTKIGVVDGNDVWKVTMKSDNWPRRRSLVAMNDFWKVLTSEGKNGYLMFSDIEDAQKYLRTLDPMKLANMMEEFDDFVNDLPDKKVPEAINTFIEELPSLYSWENLGASLKTGATLGDIGESSEVWIGGPAIFVTGQELMNDVAKYLETGTSPDEGPAIKDAGWS